MKDKFSAVWVSHSSISTYLKCPRAYYLANIYRNPETKHKITIVQPAMSLGQAVHNTVEDLSLLPLEDRFSEPLMTKFERCWEQVTGKKGGFSTDEEEQQYKERGVMMVNRVQNNPGPLKNKAIKIRHELPNYYLSEDDNIILCGRIDWLEYLPETDSVHILDFKTGKYDEDPDSLQLLIYYLLVVNCQKRKVTKASYWYLNRSDTPQEVPLPDPYDAYDKILTIAKKIKVARTLKAFSCPQKDGCHACKPYEAVLAGEGIFVGVNDFNVDMYMIPKKTDDIIPDDDMSKFEKVPDDEPF